MPCRINKKREWTGRIMLERDSHAHAAFTTLTYRQEEIHDVSGAGWNASRPVLGTLNLRDLQNFLKRLRRHYEPKKIRYFAVGEYGDSTGRPHYHVAMFGVPGCLHGRTSRNNLGNAVCCTPCKVIESTWALGRIDNGELNKDSASYIAGYVTKKWTKEDKWNTIKLKGRRTEFTRMSLKPGIGAIAIRRLISTGVGTRREKYVAKCIDAPVALRKSGSLLPLGRYLRRVWRDALGRSKDTPKSELEKVARELQIVYEENRQASLKAGVPRLFCDPKSLHWQASKQKILSLEARSKIFAQGKKI